MQVYGMTEMSPISHLSEPRRNVPGSIGKAVGNTECR